MKFPHAPAAPSASKVKVTNNEGDIMLKGLKRKIVVLSIFVAALAAVSSTSAAFSARRILICVDMPEGCPGNEKYCCDRQSGDCWCVQ